MKTWHISVMTSLAICAVLYPMRLAPAHDIPGLFEQEKLPEEIQARLEDSRDLLSDLSMLRLPESMDRSPLEAVIIFSKAMAARLANHSVLL